MEKKFKLIYFGGGILAGIAICAIFLALNPNFGRKLTAFEQFKRSQEYAWSQEGRTDLIIEKFKKLSSDQRTERNFALRALTLAIRPKPQWPAGFTDKKAEELIGFVKSLIVVRPSPASSAGSNPDAMVEASRAMNILYRLLLQMPEQCTDCQKYLQSICHQTANAPELSFLANRCRSILVRIEKNENAATPQKPATTR